MGESTNASRSLLDSAGDWKNLPDETFREVEAFWATAEELSREKRRRLTY